MPKPTVYHVHDPMCSWCWAYRPVLSDLLDTLSTPAYEHVQVRHLVGGLAPDSDVPMPAELAAHLQDTWKRIQTVVPGTLFNFDFWTENVPRRSTWPACRAVLTAEAMDGKGQEMTHAIQRAYYVDARNPSDKDVLASIAGELGMNTEDFSTHLSSQQIESALQEDFATAGRIGARGFPSLFLEIPNRGSAPLPLDYGSVATTLSAIDEYTQTSPATN